MSSSQRKISRAGKRSFSTTRWSLVLAAANNSTPTKARDALASLCSVYWYPLYAYIRHQGQNAENAQDLTQEFFLRFLASDSLQAVDRNRGRFRSYLLGALKHFLLDQHERGKALKRGGGKPMASIELHTAEGRYALEPAKGMTPEQLYERRWALTVLDIVFSRMQSEYKHAGKVRLFDRLKEYLVAGELEDSFGKAAVDLDMTEGAVKVAAHRMRRRYGQLLRDEIAETVESSEDVQDEIRQLFAALSHPLK